MTTAKIEHGNQNLTISLDSFTDIASDWLDGIALLSITRELYHRR